MDKTINDIDTYINDFPAEVKMPLELIAKIVTFRVNEHLRKVKKK